MTKRMSRPVAGLAVTALLTILTVAPGEHAGAAENWNFYMHQSAPNFATSRGAKMLAEEIEKATGGELKVRLHLSGTLQISPSNITQAVGENVVQMGDDLFNSGNIPVAGIPRLPMLVQSYEDFTKASEVLRPASRRARTRFRRRRSADRPSSRQAGWCSARRQTAPARARRRKQLPTA